MALLEAQREFVHKFRHAKHTMPVMASECPGTRVELVL